MAPPQKSYKMFFQKVTHSPPTSNIIYTKAFVLLPCPITMGKGLGLGVGIAIAEIAANFATEGSPEGQMSRRH